MTNLPNSISLSDARLCYGINISRGVRLSDGVHASNGVDLCSGVNRSDGVRLSNGVHASSGTSRANGVNLSNGVLASSGVSLSDGVINSSGVNDSFGVLECFGISNGLFCSGLYHQPRLFNMEVPTERFETVRNKLEALLNGWRPTFNNLHSLYLKHGSDWKATPISDAKEVNKREAWESMPKAAVEYLRSLEEFDPEIFYKITGIK